MCRNDATKLSGSDYYLMMNWLVHTLNYTVFSWKRSKYNYSSSSILLWISVRSSRVTIFWNFNVHKLLISPFLKSLLCFLWDHFCSHVTYNSFFVLLYHHVIYFHVHVRYSLLNRLSCLFILVREGSELFPSVLPQLVTIP